MFFKMVAQCVRLAHRQCPVEHEVKVQETLDAGLAGAQRMVLHNVLAVSVEDLPDPFYLVGRQAGIHQSTDGAAGDVQPDLPDMERHDRADQRVKPLEPPGTNTSKTHED